MKKTLLFSVVAILSLQLNAQIIITGFMSDPKGTDQPVAGSTSTCSGNTVTHQGGYEYIQLMATVDIDDFSVTPYSVVVANNGNAQAAGWATGGGTGAATTFKFNLTSGSAAKGTFFYVGSAGRVIAGYDPCVTPSVSTGTEANWIRTIDIWRGNSSEIVGDGFGHAGGNLLGHKTGTTPTNGAADGIAVFAGTNVTPSSIPIDAVFWGDNIAGAYRESGGAFVGGYQIPDNDLYTRSGGATPYFGKAGGPNTFIFPQAGVDANEFLALGGIYDLENQQWHVPRSGTLIPLNTSSTLADIESGTGILQVLPVELSSFTASYKNNFVELKWTTASEKNNDYFLIKRSPDGVDFSDIGKVDGFGDTDENREYRFSDFNPISGTSYYKLFQIDQNGEKKELGTVSVKAVFDDSGINVVSISGKQLLQIQYNSQYTGNTAIDIYHIDGRKLESIKVKLKGDNNTVEIPFHHPKGLYIVNAEINGQVVRKKILNE